MRRPLRVLALAVACCCVAFAADAEIVGSWIGAVDTDRGVMDIGLRVTETDGKLSGSLKTAHGDWTVTSITAKDGQWIVSFKADANEGQMVGRISSGKFAGAWKSKMANGTFELTRARPKG